MNTQLKELNLGAAHQDDSLIDARPRLPAANNSLWDNATRERDRIAEILDQTIRSMGLLVWVRKSKPGEYPLYVFVDNWRPVNETAEFHTTERSSLKIAIQVEPYKEKPLVYTVELRRQRKNLQSSYWEIDQQELQEMARYLVKGGLKPRFFKSRVLRFFEAIFPPLKFAFPKNCLIKVARPTRFTISNILIFGGLIGAAIFLTMGVQATNEFNGNAPVHFLLTSAFVVLLGIGIYLAYRRPILYAVPTQSVRTPRHEFLVDSWHVSVPEGGSDFTAFESRLATAIASIASVDSSIELQKEKHQHLSPRGFEERDRYVLTKNQTNVHVHIYSFGRDAFVGWDGYLNFAKWSESIPISQNVKNGAKIAYRSLVTGVHIPSEFDLIEFNCLTELIHRALVREIKLFLKEKQIETDLDFQIIRGDRERAMQAGKRNQRDTNETMERRKTVHQRNAETF
jgi:hypothetical protein